jgi:hypothetical protein
MMLIAPVATVSVFAFLPPRQPHTPQWGVTAGRRQLLAAASVPEVRFWPLLGLSANRALGCCECPRSSLLAFAWIVGDRPEAVGLANRGQPLWPDQEVGMDMVAGMLKRSVPKFVAHRLRSTWVRRSNSMLQHHHPPSIGYDRHPERDSD